ncbi:hypothetical protein SARC_03504 [Sphaeroforma arctica JP610]|uniref:Clathrin/coatomer adaptor adaptin-like N-terminal domain-containing protein n=1 Tax=Sphaeroforma arctica JP610 TaxID=667725 RepID=A0A0L0G7R9_9EUKA|nr:hypothetical protein SARC_03504 [Sphaeroforma arctica JP610]KNC84278.1 hypothetical protein SARC_03504 [Sphaeroforma arctica JP610]|eukprot:XP_014158180.1 hypothetical protein SARC_03504 [Sphaeroforma arctica JP610]
MCQCIVLGDDVQVVDENKPFYSDSDDSGAGSDSESNRESNSDSEVEQAMPVQMDADHRLLLNSVKPLLLSRNSGVVFAVAQLYYYLAPRLETAFVGQAMVRLVGLQREIAATVLSSIVTMSATRPQMFSPYLKSFFVRDDPVSVSLAKITVMVNLASETNISILLSEFGSYIRSVKTEVALAAIDGVGLCAQRLPSVTPNCIHTLTPFLSAGDETIAGQSIVVIQRLLQQPPPSTTATRPSAHHSSDSDSDSDDDNSRNQQRIDEEQAEYRDSVTRVIRSLAKLLMKGQITVPTARASVTWLVGEHVKQLPKLGPDVLRLQMKSYITLSKAEKLQVLNLASKLYLVRAKRSERYLNYVLLLTNYDADYDLRDKGRFLRGILGMKTKGIEPGRLADVLLCKKPAPAPPGKPTRDEFQLGTLSQVLGKRLHGYQPLPDFPSVAPDPTPRQVTWDRGATETSLSGKSGGFGMFPKSSNGFLNATPRTDSVGDERQRDFYSSSGSDSQTNSDSDYSNSSRRSSYSDSGSDSRSDGGHSTDSRGSARPHRHNRRAASSSSSGSQSEDFYSSSSNTDSDSSLPGRSAKTKKASKKAIPDTRSDYTDSGTDSGSQSDTGLYR